MADKNGINMKSSLTRILFCITKTDFLSLNFLAWSVSDEISGMPKWIIATT